MQKIINNTKYDLQKAYNENLQDPTFKNIVTKLKIDAKIGQLNNSMIADCAQELKNCANCRGLYECQNKCSGYYLYPKVYSNYLDFVYLPCKYQKAQAKLLEQRKTASQELETASFKNINVTDKNRVSLIKWLKDFYDKYDGITPQKGLYLHGTFGSGKTYLIYALLNELKNKKKVEYLALYFPEILRTLKDDWDLFEENIVKYSTVPILLIDDIGAEAVSEWGRDEVLGTILQNRMNEHLPTFFTSNLTIAELELHLSQTKNSIDKLKSRRIIERIKQLTTDMELITVNYRK